MNLLDGLIEFISGIFIIIARDLRGVLQNFRIVDIFLRHLRRGSSVFRLRRASTEQLRVDYTLKQGNRCDKFEHNYLNY